MYGYRTLIILTLLLPHIALAANQCLVYDDFLSQVGVFLQQTVDDKITAVESMFSSAAATTTQLVSTVDTVVTDLASTTAKINSLTLDFNILNTGLGDLTVKYDTASSSINSLFTTTGSTTASIGNITSTLDLASTSISALSIGLGTTTVAIADLYSHIAAATSSIQDLTVRLAYASSTIEGIVVQLAQTTANFQAVLDMFISSTATSTAQTLSSILSLQASTTELYAFTTELYASSTDYQVRLTNLETLMSNFVSGGGSGTNFVSANITQTAHGFVVGDWLYYNGTAWAKADSDLSTTAEAIGVVAAGGVVDANTFKLTYDGLADLTGAVYAPLTAGQVYYISGTAGRITATEPSGITSVSKPVFVAVSTTGGYIQNFRGTPTAGSTAVVQSGENTTITDAQTTTSTSYVDVTGGSITIPSAGTWQVQYAVSYRNTTATADTNFVLTDSSNVAVANSEYLTRMAAGNAFTVLTTPPIFITTTGAATYKLRWKVDAGTAHLINTTAGAEPTGSKITYTQIGASPVPMSLAGEYGSVLVNSQSFTTTSFVDSTNGIFTLPSAGTWLLRYDLATDGSGAASPTTQFQIADSSNVAVNGSQKTRGGGVTSAQMIAAEVSVTTTGPATYKIQAKNGGSGNVDIISNANARSTITWQKISGFVPTAGQTVDYVGTSDSAAAPNAAPLETITMVNSPTWNTAVSATARMTIGANQTGNMAIAGNQITVSKTGSYKFTATISGANSTTNTGYVQLVKNGTSVLAWAENQVTANDEVTMALTYAGTFTVGDALDIRFGSNGAQNFGINSYNVVLHQLGTSAAVTAQTLARVVANNSSGQSIPSATNTDITGWTELKDTTGNFVPATGIFTCPRTATYLVTVGLRYNSANWNNNEAVTAVIMKNGSPYANNIYVTPALTGGTPGANVAMLVDCVAGDTINPNTFQGNAAARTLNTTANQNTFSVTEMSSTF